MFKKLLKKFLRRIGSQLFDIQSIDLQLAVQKIATKTTAEYIYENMLMVPSVSSWQQVIDVAIDNMEIKGDVLEFGVFSGRSINYLADRLPKNTIKGFDSFEGLPEDWRAGFLKGEFGLKELPKVRDNVRLYKGWFSETLPIYVSEVNTESAIALLHIDCDLYSSTHEIFAALSDKIVIGTVIVFDEYFNFPGWQNDEFLAFKEFIKERHLKYRYLTYNRLHEQVAVQII